MRAQIIKIGNSKGLRLPKAVIEQCHFGDIVELEIEDERVILRNPASKSRAGWEKAFKAMHKNKDDVIFEEMPESEWDHTEWEW